MKKLDFLKIVIGLFLGIILYSCNKDDASVIISEQLEKQEVVFDINNFLPQDLSSKGLFSAKDNAENDPLIPECLDLEPSYVEVTIVGDDQIPIMYTLNLVTLNNKTETEVVKLTPGIYTITDFVVKAEDGTLLWASPKEGSYYELLWDLTGVDLTFEVPVFDKLKVEIDVLCYRPYNYQNFGFVWFKYAVTEIHTVCFFGDICTKFYDEWHMNNERENNPYADQDYDGYDFPAIFEVIVRNADEEIVNDEDLNSNATYYGIGQPLCIEYPDQVEIEGEIFTFEIWLAMPDGTLMQIYEGEFDDTAMAEVGNPDAFGGTDGVFDFVVGNCSYDGNDANLELLPWMPIPETAVMDVQMKVPGSILPAAYPIQAYFRDGTVMPNEIDDVIEEGKWYNTLCGEEFIPIGVPGTYNVEFYSSLDRNLPDTNFPSFYMGYPWGSLNWLAQVCEDVAAEESYYYVQQAVWFLIDPMTVDGDNNALAQEAALHSDFIPTVGDYACVLIEPISTFEEDVPNKNSTASKTNAPFGVQLLLMRVDP